MAWAVNAITGIARVAGSALIWRVASQPSSDRQAHIHQYEVGLRGVRQFEPLLAVYRGDRLESFARQPPRQHVAVHLVVFDD